MSGADVGNGWGSIKNDLTYRMVAKGEKRANSRSLDSRSISDKLSDMQTNVSGLLREFPKYRQAAMAGHKVLIKTREGDLTLSAHKKSDSALMGCMKGVFQPTSHDLTRPTLPEKNWKYGL